MCSLVGQPQEGHLVITPSAWCHGSVHFNPYGGAAADLAAALVNTDPRATPDELRDVLREHGYKPVGALDEAGTAELFAWFRRLEAVFASADRDERVRMLNALLAQSATQPYISQHDDRAPHLHFAPETAPTVERVRAYTAAGLAHVLCQDHERMGRCAREGCGVVYVDTSRNGRRRYCTTKCANRVHVAEHRERQAG